MGREMVGDDVDLAPEGLGDHDIVPQRLPVASIVTPERLFNVSQGVIVSL